MTRTQEPGFRYTGTVSHGTMQPGDLIPVFASVLESLAPEHPLLEQCKDWPDGYDVDGTDLLVEDLFEALDSCAPAGFSFGAHPGDGSDYGFWTDEEDEEDEGDAK